MVPDAFDGTSGATVELKSNFFNPIATSTANQYPSDLMEGLSNQDSEGQDHHLVDTLTQQLFPDAGKAYGSDLYSRNIQVNDFKSITNR